MIAFGTPGLKIPYLELLQAGRAQGAVGDPDFFAAMSLVFIPLGIVLASESQRKGVRILMVGATISLLAGTFLSLSRGAFLATMVLGIMFLATRPERLFRARREKAAALVLVAIGMIGFFSRPFLREEVVTRAESIYAPKTQEEASGAGRTELWKGAIRIAQENPLLGVGFGSFPIISQELILHTPGVNPLVFQKRKEGDNFVAHNTYLGTAAELGFTGLFLYLALMISTGLTLMKTSKRAMRAGAPFVGRVAHALRARPDRLGSVHVLPERRDRANLLDHRRDHAGLTEAGAGGRARAGRPLPHAFERAHVVASAERSSPAAGVDTQRVVAAGAVDRRAPGREPVVAAAGRDEARVRRQVSARRADPRAAALNRARAVAVDHVSVDADRPRAVAVHLDAVARVEGEHVVANRDVRDPVVAPDDDAAVAAADDGVVHHDGAGVRRVDLDPEAVRVAVDHVVRHQVVGALDVDPVALVLAGLVPAAVVVDPVADDVDVPRRVLDEDALVLGEADLVP